jgi:hypothetical protein
LTQDPIRNITLRKSIKPSRNEGMKLTNLRIRFFLFLLLPMLSLSCLPYKKLAVGTTATLLEDVAKASSKQTDLKTIREGTPAYLMLMDGMVEAWPGNDQLLLSAARAYSSFASAFPDDHDQEYEALLFGKARQYALRALERRGFPDPVRSPLNDFKEGLKRLGKVDLPYLFWGATCWANWINLNLDSMEALAELPRVELMMERTLQLDEKFYYGGPHLFMGIWFASRPKIAGGDLKKAQEHFLKALDFGQGKFLMAYVYYADYYARRAFKKELYIQLLKKVLETPPNIEPDLTLFNTVAQKRAKEMLAHVKEYFE